MSHFNEFKDMVPLQIWEGVVGRVWNGESAALAVIELEPGSIVPEHSHPNEQTGFLLRGTLTFRIGGETKELRPGCTWVVPSAVPHEVHVGPEGALLVELFAPPRDDWAGLPTLEPRPIAGF